MKTQKLYYLLIFLSSIGGYSQSALVYSYDASGNQISREPETYIAKTVNSSDTIASLSNTEKLDLLSPEEIANKFEVSPNPTSGLAELKWKPEVAETIWKIELVSLLSSERANIAFSKANSVSIDLSGKITGLYVVLFHLRNQEIPIVQKKLIKQ